MTANLLITVYSIGTCSTTSVAVGSDNIQTLIKDEQTGQPVLQLQSLHGSTKFLSEAEYQIVDENGVALEDTPVDILQSHVYRLTKEVSNSLIAAIYIRFSTSGLKKYQKLAFLSEQQVVIGSDASCDIRYQNQLIPDRAFTLSWQEDVFVLSIETNHLVYVNGSVASCGLRSLKVSDVVEMGDLRFAVGERFISINNPEKCVVSSSRSDLRGLRHSAIESASPNSQHGDHQHKSEFLPSPRLMQSIHEENFELDPPPQHESDKGTPAILQIGPSFLMGIASIFMMSSAISRLNEGAELMTILPTLAMTVSMVVGMVLWPILNNWYNKRRKKKTDRLRISRYTDYLNRIEESLRSESMQQLRILQGNRISVYDVMRRVLDHSSEVMNRTSRHADFLDLRIGTGAEELQANVRYPKSGFSIDSDELLNHVKHIQEHPQVIEDTPISLNLAESYIVGMTGIHHEIWGAARGLVVQLAGLYSYNSMKIIIVADGPDEEQWDFMKRLPHCFSDDRSMRFIASQSEDMFRLDRFLQRLYEERISNRNIRNLAEYGTYYVIICASRTLGARSSSLSKWAENPTNLGLSIIYLADEISKLPNQCATVVQIGNNGQKSLTFNRDDVSETLREFICDIEVDKQQARDFAQAMAGIDLQHTGANAIELPQSLGYMEMMKAGKVADLNVEHRWHTNDSSRTLQAQIGMDSQSQPFILNLHEDSHGPHGLIAGMTGSGKSELIITYILSMALNYPPDQVSFVLIDYKGGGLAGAFSNERHILPHLSGTITNLDGAGISRSLVSIQSELQRRQRLFNEARETTGEPTMDIYKYLSYYRQGILKEPVPHLFIVADEFAELKQQEPQFMDELISAARIGRSLGIHLILATQKPTGVVNDQIWSNSRFKISLKVADSSDSKEMIRRPDAAELKNAGRFYLLVGYNDYFAAGQSAYTGVRYQPSDHFEQRHDDAVTLIGNTADTIARLRPPSQSASTKLTELDVIVDQICMTAKDLGLKSRNLWLEPLPSNMSVPDLRTRFLSAEPQSGCTAMYGIVDDPRKQEQRVLSVDIARKDNVVVYGSAQSGSEDLVATIVDSLLRDYTADQIAIYGIDFGSGTLSAFEAAPQVGSVVSADDKEQVINLFRRLEEWMVSRRRQLAEAGQRYDEYIKSYTQEEVAMPRIIVVITNIGAFYDICPELDDRFVALTHDGPRYGIHFVVTSSSANQLHMRVKTNFGASIVTSFNDDGDYMNVFGSIRGIVIPHQHLRGIIAQHGNILEFQAAQVEKNQELRERYMQLAHEWNGRTAPPIPVLPQVITPEMVSKNLHPRLIPMGFDKSRIEPFVFDGQKVPAIEITGNDSDMVSNFCNAMCAALFSGESKVVVVGQDDSGSLVLTDNDGTTQELQFIIAKLKDIAEGRTAPDVLIFKTVAQTMSTLPPDVSAKLAAYFEKEQFRKTTTVIVCGEAWRLGLIYENWFKTFKSNEQGIWVGPGFNNQSMFNVGYMEPEYRQKAGESDGFAKYQGSITRLRLVQSNKLIECESKNR